MDHTVKAADLKLQRTQQTPLRSVYALARVCDVCVASQNSETKGLLRVITDAIGLTLTTIRDISLDRRANILNIPNMNQKYRQLASINVPITKHLIGDELKAARVH